MLFGNTSDGVNRKTMAHPFSIGQAVLYGALSRFVDDEEYGVASGRELILKVFE